MKPELVVKLFRDVGMITVGLGGIVYQIATERVNDSLLLTCLTLLGATTGVNVWELKKFTRERSLQSQEHSSLPSQSSSSSN